MADVDKYGKAAIEALEHARAPQYMIEETESLGVGPDNVVIMALLYEILKELRELNNG